MSSISREEFSQRMVELLGERSDLTNHTSEDSPKKKPATVPTINARDVAKKLCFDFPDVTVEECMALADALGQVEWRVQERLSPRCADGIAYVAGKRRDDASESTSPARLAVAAGVGAVRAVLEMPRSHVVRFASKAIFEVKTRLPVDKKQGGIDYSKWDHLDSDDDDDAELEAARLAAATPSPSVVDPTMTRPIDSVKDAVAFARAFARVADYPNLSGLDASTSDESRTAWLGAIDNAAWLARVFRGDETPRDSWIMRKRDVEVVEDFCREGYERYVFLLRDACLHQPATREASAKALVALAVGSGGPRSAKDGGVALVALGSVAAHCDGPHRDSAVRDAALAALGAVSDLIRGLATGRGPDADGDATLLGAALAIVEAASGVRTTAKDGDLDTSFAPSGTPRTLVDSGALSALCALAPRLAAETDPRAKEAEARLHRALVSFVAQSPEVAGAFLVRARILVDIVADRAFEARCPVEALLWAGRLSCVGQLEPKLADRLRAVLDDALNRDLELPLAQVALAQLLQHLNATKAATKWFAQDAQANLTFWRLRDKLLLTAASKDTSPGSSLPSPDDGERENLDKQTRDDINEKTRQQAVRPSSLLFARYQVRRLRLRPCEIAGSRRCAVRQLDSGHGHPCVAGQAKLLPLAPRTDDASGNATPINVRGKVD